MMFESPMASERSSLRRGFCLDLNDPKRVKSESQRDVLTSKDLGMLELTTPELERLILDPTNDRFMAGSGIESYHNNQRLQPGQGTTIPRDQQDRQRSLHSSLNQLRQQQANLPEPALEAALTSDEEEDSDTGSRQSSFVPKSNSYYNMDWKPAKAFFVSSMTACPSTRMGTVLTAMDPGVSYLPPGAFTALQSRLKEEPMQQVPCREDSPASGSLPPMSPIDMDEQDRAKQERKRERNRLAARKCRTKKLEQIMLLEGHVKELKEQNRALGDAAASLRALMLKLQSQITQHVNCGCPMMMPNSSSS